VRSREIPVAPYNPFDFSRLFEFRQDFLKVVAENLQPLRFGLNLQDLLPPGDIHAEFNGPERTIAVILRSAKVGGFMQNHFDVERGTVKQAPGPRQVPYALK